MELSIFANWGLSNVTCGKNRHSAECTNADDLVPDVVFNVLYIYRFYYLVYMYTIVLVNVKRFRALCGFYAIQNNLLLLLLNS